MTIAESPDTSLLPRFLASLIVKKFGNSGGIYGDPTQNMKEHRGYFTYTYSLSGYKSLFKSVGLKTGLLCVSLIQSTRFYWKYGRQGWYKGICQLYQEESP